AAGIGAEHLKLYSSTGLSSSSCEKIQAFVTENEERLLTLLTTANSYNELLSILGPPCLTLSEMQSDKELNINFNELLFRWLSGMSIKEILRVYENQIQDIEDLSSFIEDLFSYRLPWGMAGLIQIA